MRAARFLTVVLLVTGCAEQPPERPVAVTVSVEGARDHAAAYSPDGSQVAFWRIGEKGWDLWVSDAEMTAPRQIAVLTNLQNLAPVWSPDGAMLTVSSGVESLSEIAIIRVSDGTITSLTSDGALKIPQHFHPDGDRIVYLAISAGGQPRGYTVSQRTKKVEPLVPGLERPYAGVVSPDGATVLYVETVGASNTIWRADAETGKNRRALTTDGYEGMGSTIAEQLWSPNGKEFLFVSRRTGKGDIWVGSLDGTLRQLTTDINDDVMPAWSPDGNWVAFRSDRGRQSDVWVIPAAGGEAIRVSDDPTEKVMIQWLPDGEVAYSSAASPGAIWSRNLATGNEVQVTPDSLDAGDFWLSPDRRRMAFLIDHVGGINDLAVMTLRGSDRWVLATGAHHTDVYWSPDGTRLAYSSDIAGDIDVWEAEASGVAAPRRLIDWVGLDRVAGWALDSSGVLFLSPKDAVLGDVWQVGLGADSTPPRRLTTLQRVAGAVVARGVPEARLILTVSDSQSGRFYMGVRDSDSSVVRIPTSADGVGYAVGAFPSPVADLVAFGVFVGGPGHGEITRLDGTPVTTLGTNEAVSDFSLDGTHVVIVRASPSGGGRDLALMEIATGARTELPTTPENESHAAFNADGSQLILRRVTITERLTRVKMGSFLPRE